MPYDELGNYIPGDEPSIDEMRLALSQSKPAPSGRRQETEAEYKARMVNQLPPAFGVEEYRPPYVEPYVPPSTAKTALGQVLDRTGITALPQAALAIASSYPSAVATEMGYKDLGRQLQYEPTSRHANQIVERLGHAMEAAKIPAYVAHIPMARPYMTPNDVRVLGAQVAKTGREIRDIPADFVNAQSGLKRQDIFGQPTLGTRLQGAAENIGDVMARREMQGLSAVPGIPASIVPETKMYAVRPANYGQIIEQSDLPGKPGQYASGNLNTVRDIIEDIRPPDDRSHPGHKLATYERNFFSPIDGMRETMRQLEFARIREMYPDAPTEADAIDAYRRTRSDQEQAQDKLKWYDESIKDPKVQELVDQHNFERQLLVNELNQAKMQKKSGLPPEQKREIDNRVRQLEQDLQNIPEINLPSLAEYERRLKAADRYLNTEFKNEIKKYIGTSEGAMMNLAKKGITFRPAEEIIYSAEDLKRDIARSGSTGDRQTVEQAIEESRTKAGFNPKGETFPMVEAAQTKFDDAQTKLNELNSEKFALREQHLLENPDIPDPAQNPGPLGERYRALTNKIESAASARDKSKKELDNFRLANAYELLSDYAYVPMTARQLKDRLEYAERATAFPNLAKTPDDAQMFNVRETMINDAMGLKDAGDRYAEAIIRGEIPLDKNDRPTKSLDKYIEETTELRRKKEDYERALESRKEELLTDYAKSTVSNIPSDLKFGNASALELTKDTPFADVRRQISFDGSVFDHCVAAVDAPHPGTNPYTGQRYGYSFPVDPATGIERTSKSSSYMEGVKSGEKMITSLRDNVTGLPAATIEFKNRKDDGTYKIGYVSSHKNDPVSAEYRNDLRDYLNKRSDIIRDVDSGMAALYKSGVYDTARTESQLMSYGLSRRDVELLQNTDHPRFITSEDLARLRSAPDDTRNGLVQQRQQVADELADAESRMNDIRSSDPDNIEGLTFAEETIDDLRLQLQDLDQRIDRLPAVRPQNESGVQLPSTQSLRRQMREGQVSEVRDAYDYIIDGERFADDFNWEADAQMNAINAIRNDGNLNATVLNAEDVRMIRNMTPNQRELLARELEQNFAVNMEQSLANGVVDLADFDGQYPGMADFYNNIETRARGELRDPTMPDILADITPTQIQAEPNAGNRMIIQSARNEAFGPLDEVLREDVTNIVDRIELHAGMNDLPAMRDAALDEANAIYNAQRFAHYGAADRLQVVNALNTFARELEPARATPAPARRAEPVITDLNQTLQESLESARGLHTGRDMNAATEALDDISRNIDLTDDPTDFINQVRGRADNSRDQVSAILNNIADDLEGAMEAPAPQRAPATTQQRPQAVSNLEENYDYIIDALLRAEEEGVEVDRNQLLQLIRNNSIAGGLPHASPEDINLIHTYVQRFGTDAEFDNTVVDEIYRPERRSRRIRRITGENTTQTLQQVRDYATEQMTNSESGSRQAYTTFMNDLRGHDRDFVESQLARAINRTANENVYDQAVMNEFNLESPGAVRQFHRALQHTFDNLPRQFASGGLVQRFKDGGSVTDDVSGYSQTFENPDKSKVTESGIIKKFEEDYLKFAMQRREMPRQEFMPEVQPQTNKFVEYGTPAMGGMVSGRLTKMGEQPDTYMGDLTYRTPVGPGMFSAGVNAMKNPYQSGISNYNVGYGVPLGENGFAGVNVVQPAQGGKPIYNAQVQYRKRFAEGGEVSVDEMRLELMRNK